MTAKNIVKMGNAQLATPSSPVKNFTDGELKALIQDMEDSMHAHGGIGIAAPQIGCNLRVILYGFDHSERYPNEKPVSKTVLVNPTLEMLTEEMIEGWEGCLSVPGLRGFVPRYTKLRYNAFDINGNPLTGIAEGFHARVLQHECDHIDGILFPRRINDLKNFGYEDELASVIWPSRS